MNDKKKKELRDVRHELRAVVAVIAQRDVTDQEYYSINTLMNKYMKIGKDKSPKVIKWKK